MTRECERLIMGGISADGQLIDNHPLTHVVDGLDDIPDCQTGSCGKK